MSQKIFLVGLPGAGKTTMGLELGLHLTIPFVDLDQEIEKDTKQSVKDIFSEKGEAYFRQLEKEHLEKVCDAIPAFVLSTGGGTPCFFNNMELMKSEGDTVFVNTPIEMIKGRIENDSTRPLMKSNTLENLLENRIHFYSKADHEVKTLKELIGLFPIKS